MRSRPEPNTARRVIASSLAGILVGLWWGPSPAHAAMQDDLCQGAPRGCGISLSHPHGGGAQSGLTVVDSGQRYSLNVSGNAGVDVEVQFYAVEFNSSGAVTGLVPAGSPVAVRANQSAEMVPRSVGGQASGWGFVGLADDTSIDLRSRIGTLYEFSGLTLKLLGDGYADLKPVGSDLEMWTLGNVRGVGYWVEYLDVDGTWKEVPGQGYNAPQRLTTTPGETSSVTYQVPDTLEAGRPYTFRINNHANFSRPGVLLRSAEFAEWTVIPSGGSGGSEAPRGDQLDPNGAPGVPDPTGEPQPSDPGDEGEPVAPAPNPGGTGAGAQRPGPGQSGPAAPGEKPSVKPSDKPSQNAGQKPTPQSNGSPAPSAAPTTPPSPSSSATAMPSTPPAGGSPSQGPSPAPSAPTPSTAAESAPVWGEEKYAVTSSATRAEGPTSWMWALVLLAAVAAPGVWWVATRRRTVRDDLEVSV